jgi:hypothetical protein
MVLLSMGHMPTSYGLGEVAVSPASHDQNRGERTCQNFPEEKEQILYIGKINGEIEHMPTPF